MTALPVHIALASPEDYEKLADITIRAFENDSQHQAFFPPNSDQSREDRIKHTAIGLGKAKEKHNVILKAVSTNSETGEEKIVGVGEWLSSEYKRAPMTEAPPSSDKEVFMTFFAKLEAKHRELLGDRPHYYCHLIVVDPEYHRRGVGAALVKWGTQEADKDGVASYIEATPAGLGLYLKLGFVAKATIEFEDRKGQVHKTVCLVREPQTE